MGSESTSSARSRGRKDSPSPESRSAATGEPPQWGLGGHREHRALRSPHTEPVVWEWTRRQAWRPGNSPYIRLCGIFDCFCVRTDVRCPLPRPHQTTSCFLGQEPTLSSLPLSWWGASAHRGPGWGSAFFGCPSLTCLDSVGSSTPGTLERLAVCCWAWEPPGLLDWWTLVMRTQTLAFRQLSYITYSRVRYIDHAVH